MAVAAMCKRLILCYDCTDDQWLVLHLETVAMGNKQYTYFTPARLHVLHQPTYIRCVRYIVRSR